MQDTDDDFLFELYEAINNSIHSIEVGKKEGKIHIQIIRKPHQSKSGQRNSNAELPIMGFIIVDVTSTMQTAIQLKQLKLSYSLEEICIHVIKHFIAYLVTGAFPFLKISDGAATRDICDFYQKSIGKHTSNHEFKIKRHHFDITVIKFFLESQVHNTGFICANKHVTERILLSKYDPFFSKCFIDDKLCQYAIYMFVQAEYLNKIVNDDRDGNRFPGIGTDKSSVDDIITKEEISEKLIDIAREAIVNIEGLII